MSFSLKKLIEERWGENYELHEQYVNPQFVKVLRTIGFDKVYKKAGGQYLYDGEGNRYLDFLSGYGVFGIGRNHPHIKETIRELLDLDLSQLVQMDCSLLSGLLAEKLVSLTSKQLDTVFFTNSGTEAVEGALKFARGATGRNRILYLDHSFHGLTLGSLSVNGNAEFRDGFGELLPASAIPLNDLTILEHELKKGDCAAFIFEPIQGKGLYLPEEKFLPEAQRLCRKYGTLFIADEVQAGLGRTGKWFAYQHWNLEPDIVCIAKTLSGGFTPVGAILYRREIYKKIFSRMDRCVVHSNSFGKNNLAMACGLATLQMMEDEKLPEKATSLGEKMISRLREIGQNYEMFKEVRGKGLMFGVEFHEPKSLKLKAAWKMIHAANKGLFGQMIVVPLMANHRILSQVAGHNIDLVKFLPPLIISDEDVDYFLKSFEKVVADCHKFPGATWEVGMTLAKNALRSKTPLSVTSPQP
ncbi:MAG: aspartate aminotransferase family protein [Deltaproteobacteria bacterium]|nr:aspartate aminotransferase family protein [Deltaproteobacteria bacterium]